MKSLHARRAALGIVLLGGMILSAAASADPVPSFSDVPMLDGQSDFCLGQFDGTYKHPDCRVYYRCHRGGGAEVKCPDGQVFDEKKNPNDVQGKSYCSVPESVANLDCGGLKTSKR